MKFMKILATLAVATLLSMPAAFAGDEIVINEAMTAVVQVQDLDSHGSGFYISDDVIMTNYHVVFLGKDWMLGDPISETIIVKSESGYTTSAAYIGGSYFFDIALFKVEKPEPNHGILEFDTNITRGEQVYALGNPWMMNFTVTSGIVSYLNRVYDSETLGIILQHDAKIHSGSSGGPLINDKGGVVGMNTFIHRRDKDGDAMYMAVNSTSLEKCTEEILEYGDCRLAILGLEFGGFLTISKTKSLNSLKVDDRIVKINGTFISDYIQLRLEMLKVTRGDDITVTVVRDGKMIDLTFYPRFYSDEEYARLL